MRRARAGGIVGMGRQRRAAGVPAAASDAFLLVRVLVPALRLRLDKRLVAE